MDYYDYLETAKAADGTAATAVRNNDGGASEQFLSEAGFKKIQNSLY